MESLKRVRKSVDKDYGETVHVTASKKSKVTTGVTAKEKRIAQTIHNEVSNTVRTILLPSVALSKFDKAPQLLLSRDQLSCRGYEGGYRMARATNAVYHGSYYFEVEILQPLSADTHYRVGWSTRQGELQGPVGYDKYSFGYGDVKGASIHNSVRIDTYGEPYGPGDVIGCFISLSDNVQNNRISFFKNGVHQGVAFQGQEVQQAIYFPAISLYMKGLVRVNFGPSFIKKHDIFGANAVSELQPMNPEDRKVHETKILSIRRARGDAI